jgi:hypothetical protein
MEQEAVNGNRFERHMFQWTADELRRLGFDVARDGRQDSYGNQMLLAVLEPTAPSDD